MQISFLESPRSTETDKVQNNFSKWRKQPKIPLFSSLRSYAVFENCHQASTGKELKRIEQIVRQSEQWQQ